MCSVCNPNSSCSAVVVDIVDGADAASVAADSNFAATAAVSIDPGQQGMHPTAMSQVFGACMCSGYFMVGTAHTHTVSGLS